jgi:formate dehydrogenase maturation protein FdhE
MDAQCQQSLDQLNENRELTSSAMVATFVEQLERLESKDRPSVISAMFSKPSEV